MKRIYIFLSFFLCFIIAFSPISYAATGSGEFNPFIEGFPLNEDISLYNSVDTPYHYNFYSDTESLVTAAVTSFGSSKNFVFDINDIQYILFYKDKYNLQLLFWDKSAVPEIEFNVLDSYNQLIFIPSVISNRDDTFRLGFIQMYCGSSSSGVSFTSSHYTSTYVSTYLRWYPEADTNHEYQPSDKGWFTQLLPVCQRGAELPFVFQDSTYYLFDNTPVEPEEPSEDDIVIPDIPEDTDSSIVTLIKSIASFFSQLIGKLKNLFNNLINNIKNFIQDIIDTINNVLFEIEQLFHGITSIFNALYSYGLDVSGEFSVIKMIKVIFLPDDDYFNQKFNTFWDSNFSWVLYGRTIFNSIVDIFTDAANNPTAPEIIIPAGSYGSFVLQDDVVWSFDWYLDYKPTADRIIAAFIYLMFIYRMITSLPSVISGIGSPFVSGVSVYKNSDLANKKRGV